MKFFFSSLALLCALVPLWDVYQNSYFFVTLAAGLFSGIAISVLGIWLKIKAGLFISLVLVLFVLIGVPATLPQETLFSFLPSLNGLWVFLPGLVTSWRDVLTIPPPLGIYGNTLIPVYFLSFWGTVLTFALLRSEKSQKIALLIPILILLSTTALSGTGGYSPFFCGFAVIGFTLATAALFAQHVRAWRIRAFITVFTTLTITFTISGALSVPPAQDLRSTVGVPLKLDQQASPLSLYRSLVSDPLSSTNLLSISGLPAGQTVSLAKMDEYDNEFYRLSDATTEFIRRAAFKSAVDSESIQKATITLENLEGPWLPLTGDLVSLSFQGNNAAELGATFFYSAPSGTAVTTSKINPGESYSSNTLSIPLVPFTEIPSFKPAQSSKPKNSSFQALDEFFTSVATTQETSGQQLYQTLQKLSTGTFIVWDEEGNPNTPGHDQARLTDFLTSDQLAGDAEQFASTAALLAEKAGFPSRVVVGFISTGAPQIQGKDATAWVEIQTSDGWKAFDPTPGALSAALAEAQQVATETQNINPKESPIPKETSSNSQNIPTNSAESGKLFFQTSMILLTSFLLYSVLIPAVKLIRRLARKKTKVLQNSAIGAWEELIDMLADRRIPVDKTKTRHEISQALDSTDATVLANIADFAEFSHTGISDDQKSKAWESFYKVKSAISQTVSIPKRLFEPWSLRSFRKLLKLQNKRNIN